ncbi:hypothetical protein BJ684DRAFT_15726 [Piptocephalis cylindrospora]|uniref:Uncharacterized protein n=1 Tax=Piptocephalis cylindrospora TaxID=1907219 RepID=A0A4P9Y4R5_9FUNG|nr:hypothetical protein BJ684DRAFT_15726 [Piptocephalis cylindrospora]|eukprot:RKP13915.1 hypothetical protein BJ684DRAFT_15726 [Piptocephalis cylindrospora]
MPGPRVLQALLQLPRYTPKYLPLSFTIPTRSYAMSSRPVYAQKKEEPPTDGAPLALPSTDTADQTPLGSTARLESLGPVVVNVDGSISRINNWAEMAPIERSNVERILLKRNRQRLDALRQAEEKGQRE